MQARRDVFWALSALALLGVVGAYQLDVVGQRTAGSRRDIDAETDALRSAPREGASRPSRSGAPRHVSSTEVLAQALRAYGRSREEAAAATAENMDEGAPEPIPVEVARDAIRNGVIRGYPVKEVPRLLAAMLDEQPSNPTWSREMRDEVELAMERTGDDLAELREADCHETFCKIVTTHGSSAEARQFWHEAEDNSVLGGPRHRFTRVVEGDRVESTCFVGRPGHDEEVHGALYDRMYKELTSKEVTEIQPSEEQISQAMAQLDQDS